MKKSIFIFSVLALGLSAAVSAQSNRVTLQVNYSVAAPVGDFKNVVDKTSFLGFGADIMYNFNPKFSLGFSTGSQDFYQKHPRQVYKSGDGSDISAVVSYSIQTVPLLAKGKYNFLPNAVVQPYLALGAGGNLIAYRQFAGEFSNSSKTKFGFAVSPEAGVRIPVGKSQKAAINLSAGYNYMPFKYDGIDRLDNVSVRAGVAFPLN